MAASLPVEILRFIRVGGCRRHAAACIRMVRIKDHPGLALITHKKYPYILTCTFVARVLSLPARSERRWRL